MIIASPQLDHLAMIDPALSPLNGTLYGDRGAFTALLDSLSKLPEPQDGSYGVRQAKDTLSNPQDKTRESVPVPQSGDEAREAGKARTGSADETPATGRFPGNEPRKAQRNVQKDPAAGKEAAEAALRDQLRGENPETGDKESGLETASVAVLAGALAAAEEPLMSGVESGTEISGAGLSLENSAPVVAGQAPRAGTGPGGTEGGTVSQDTAAQAGTTLNMAAGVQTAEASDTAEVVQSGLNAVARAAAEPGLESGQETVPKPATEKTGRKLRAGASAQMAAGESATVKSNRQAAPRRETEGEGSGDKTGADTRTRDKRRERLAVEIRDQRTQIDPNRNQPSEALARSNGQVGTEITVDLRAQANSRADSSAPGAGPQEGNFQDMLARELHENLNTDIVRHASIILRDGG
ncbi:MAG: hypothetical protein LBT11_01015, partial [Treponema sp.]|nr:hypothetical protein [Treponema sp.]